MLNRQYNLAVVVEELGDRRIAETLVYRPAITLVVEGGPLPPLWMNGKNRRGSGAHAVLVKSIQNF